MTYSEWLEQRKKQDAEIMINTARKQAGVQTSDYSEGTDTKYQQWLKKRQKTDDLNRIESLVRDYRKDYNDNFESFANRFTDNNYRGDYKEFQDNFNSFYSTQKKRADEIQSLFRKYKNDFNSDYVKEVNDYIDGTSESYSDIGKRAQSDTDFFSQFADEADYKYYTFRAEQQKKYRKMSDEELDRELKKLEEQKNGKNFTEKAYKATNKVLDSIIGNIPGVDYDKDDNNLQTDIDIIKRVKLDRQQEEYEKLPEKIKSVLDEYGKLANEQEQAEVNAVSNSFFNALNAQDSTSGADVEQIINTKDRKNEVVEKLKAFNIPEEKIKQYTDTAKRIYNKEWMQEQKDEYAEAAKEHPVLQSTASILSSPLKAVAGVDMLKSALDDSGTLDVNSPYYKFNNYVNTVRETTQETVDWKPNAGIKALDRDYFDDLYSTVMSTGDSLFSGFITMPAGGIVGTGVSSALSGINIGVQAATDAAIDVSEKGGTKEQALLTGLFAGVNESLWESFSIGKFKALTEKPVVNGVKGFVKNLGKSAFVNATEEFNTEVANIFVDYIVNRDYSDVMTEYYRAIASGKDEKEAIAAAAAAMAKQAFDAGMGGALQGVLMGGAGQVKAVATQNKYTNAMKSVIASDAEYKSNLIEAALKMPDSSQAFKIAKNLNAETATPTDIYELLYYMASPEGETAVAEDNIKAVTNEFINQGLAEKDAADLARFAYKLTGGRFKISSDDVVKLAVFSDNTEAQTAVSNVLANPNNMVVNTIADNYDNLNNAVNKFTDELKNGKTTKEKLRELFEKSRKEENEEPEQETPAESETPEKAEAPEKAETQPSVSGTIKTVRNQIGLDSVEVTDSNGNTEELDPDSEAYNTVKYGVQLGLSDAEITKILNYAVEHKVSAGSLMTEISAGRMGLKTNFKTTSGLDETTAAEYRKKGQDSRPVTKSNIQRALKTGVRFENISPSIVRTLDNRQKAGLRLASVVSNYVGNKVVVYSSETVERDGKKVNVLSPELQKLLNTPDDNVPYGATSYKDGTVYIDLNGKGRAADLYAYTLAHEYTHFIRMNNSAKFRVLADFLVNSLVENGTNVQQLIEQRMERTGNDFDYEYEEFIAECCEEMLLSEDFGEHFHNLYETDKSLAQRLIKYLKKMRDVFKKATEEYKDEDGSGLSQEAREMRKLTKDVYKNAARLYAEALKGASDSYRAKEQNNKKAETKNTAENTAENTVKYQQTNNGSLLNVNERVIDISDDSELSKKVKNLHGSKRYVTIKNYILDVLSEQPIKLSDGIQAYVDKSDARHISNKAGDKKVANISKIKEIVEKAKFTAYEDSKDISDKFNSYRYYETFVKYDNDIFPVYVNVGLTKNDKTYHVYDITQKIRDTAHRVNDVWRLSKSFAIENGISTNRISQKSENVKENSEKTENSNKKDAFRYQGRGNGYDGYSMSNNAREAYENGEMPLSKWSKAEIINAISEINPDINCSKIFLEVLKEKFLEKKSWHHTSKFYNETDFYALNEDYVRKLTQDEVDNIAEKQKTAPKYTKSKTYDELVDDAYFKARIIVAAGLIKTEAGILANRIVGEKKSDDDTQSFQ